MLQKYNYMWCWYCTMWGCTIKYEKKIREPLTKCDKSIVTCDVGTAQCENSTIKLKKKKRTNECDKSTITCDVDTAQCEDGTIKCEKKIRELPTKCDKNILTCDFGTA